MVTVGIYSSAMSAAMSNLIGASRILYALSKDNLFGEIPQVMQSVMEKHIIYFVNWQSWVLVDVASDHFCSVRDLITSLACPGYDQCLVVDPEYMKAYPVPAGFLQS